MRLSTSAYDGYPYESQPRRHAKGTRTLHGIDIHANALRISPFGGSRVPGEGTGQGWGTYLMIESTGCRVADSTAKDYPGEQPSTHASASGAGRQHQRPLEPLVAMACAQKMCKSSRQSR